MPRLDLEAHRRHLLDHGDELVRQVLTGTPDADLPGLEVHTDAIHYRAGRDVTVGYQVVLEQDAVRQEEYLLATTADVTGEVATLDSEQFGFRVWRHPHDPVLASAPEAFSPDAVAGWLATAGLASGEVALTAVAYRPMRRAVLRADVDGGRWFVKLQRPKRHLEYLERMALLAPAGVTPPVVAVPAEGVTITAAAEGVSLAQALAAWSMQGAVEPDPASLLELLGRLPGGVRTLPPQRGHDVRLRMALETAAVELPGRASEIADLGERLLAADARAELGPVVATHGDFYEANIFTVDGRATSVIDIESAGPGHLVDDLATLMAHLVVLPDLSAVHYAQLPGLIDRWYAAFCDVVDGPTLRARTAGLILGLMSGAGEAQASARLDRALAWAPRA
ncbi:aminoglycoside phosphotransferase family protein [Propioniciclava sp. MC1595]|uniref:aminoglycoside phosphotransferase family protein n=1 Tax=unclassified Propioniciclava TaxID=2642922 RepID=UPI0016032CD7|nr:MULTISPECIES: aminoglycoside phosphotransferase family protein [unclassified Propioniciclava]MBB1494757.1 aminoglycoside phosphotransferase family protein [Propioniciclava sp. MC1595]MBB1500399.1 aminoglycoside phosphotransferase family protein [Propioniciclava sp. MC1683]QTE25829.1 aminoglycoside phosphotransferase family protein [Propioniciclava sp. MC1595]